MSQFESSVKNIPYAQEAVYAKLSDLTNLESVKDKLKEQDLSFDHDTMSFNVPPVGMITLQVVERDPCKSIKFETVTSPFPFKLWVQLVPVEEGASCKIKLTIQAELNLFIQGMIKKPLQEGLEKMVEMLSKIPY